MGIFSQTAGSTCEFWVNPVDFTFPLQAADRPGLGGRVARVKVQPGARGRGGYLVIAGDLGEEGCLPRHACPTRTVNRRVGAGAEQQRPGYSPRRSRPAP
jgi:hypothetical protein